MSDQKITVTRVVSNAPGSGRAGGSGGRPPQGGCGTLLLRWMIAAGGIWLVAYLLEPNVHVDGFVRAMIVAAVVGFLNVVVRPILFMLTLPITIVTLGLFLIVINAVVISMSAWLLEGFDVNGFGWALIAAALVSVFNMVVDSFTK